MIYSVPTERCTYIYCEGSGSFPATGRFREPVGDPIKGMYPPEAFAASLPSGTRAVGEGKLARGIMAVKRSLLGEIPAPVKQLFWDASIGIFVGWLTRRWFR